MASLWSLFLEYKDSLLEQTLEHIGLTFLSLALALLIAIPGGILATRFPRLAPPLLGFAGVIQTIPSIALLGFLLPVFGIGIKPAILALFLYALLPILRNTYTGIREVDVSIREAAVGMGMTPWQVLTRVELPLALPVIFAGVRTATVINVGVATLAAFIGAGGLGEFIFGGIALNNNQMILGGAIPAALLAVGFDQLLAALQRLPARRLGRLLPRGLFALPVLSMAYFFPTLYQPGYNGGFPHEFVGRPDGYDHLVETYDLQFRVNMLNSSLMYQAVYDGFVDVICGYSTDGRIKAYDLVVLEDDRRAFPPYQCAPLVRSPLGREHPELLPVLDLLAGRINDSVMTELNFKVDHLKQSPEAVAGQFLRQQGLWRADRSKGGQVITIGSKIFSEQYILSAMYAQLINGYTDLDVEVKNGLGGTQICFEALRRGDIDLYPEYTGTGLLVLLQPDTATVERLIADPPAVYAYVDEAFQQQYQLDWLQPLGFNNAYALMMRREYARQRGIRQISDLKR